MRALCLGLFLIFSIYGGILVAQPANDNCANATTLTAGVQVCNTLDNATTQEPTETYDLDCANSAQDKSVWFSFTATSTKVSISLYKNESGTVTDSKWAIAIYHTSTAGCYPAGSTAFDCTTASAINGNDDAMILNETGLTVGDKYLLQVTYKPGNSNAPDFCLTENATNSCGTCASPCGAECVYGGYVPTQSQVTSTCTPFAPAPAIEGAQTATECFTFTADKSKMFCGLLLKDGESGSICNGETWSYNVYTSACGSVASGNFNHSTSGTTAAATSTLINYTFTIGQSYTICYTVKTSGSCFAIAVYPYVYPNQILPIQMTSFTGDQTGENVTLNWATASEENNDYFIVQRSDDGMNFTDLSTIDGNGTSTVGHDYSYIDHAPQTGLAYYRLAQVDFGAIINPASTGSEDDNKIHYSSVIAVDFQPVQLYQFAVNPTFADIHVLQPSQASVVVFDERGVIVFSTVVSGPTSIQVSTINKKGIWFACIIQGNRKEMMAAF